MIKRYYYPNRIKLSIQDLYLDIQEEDISDYQTYISEILKHIFVKTPVPEESPNSGNIHKRPF